MRTPAPLIAALTALAGSGCSLPPPAPGALPPELRLETVRFRFYRADTLRAFGVAENATLRRDSSVLHARNVEATLPRGSELPVLIAAPPGEGALAARTFSATGGLVVSRGTDVARTATARFEPEGREGIVRGDDPVVVTGRGYRLTGAGFTLDPDAGTILVRGGASLLAGLPEGR